MEVHDCNVCGRKGACGIEFIQPWVAEHQDELRKAREDMASKVLITMEYFVNVFPPIQIAADEFAVLVNHIFTLGYYKARVLPAVPEIFKL